MQIVFFLFLFIAFLCICPFLWDIALVVNHFISCIRLFHEAETWDAKTQVKKIPRNNRRGHGNIDFGVVTQNARNSPTEREKRRKRGYPDIIPYACVPRMAGAAHSSLSFFCIFCIWRYYRLLLEAIRMYVSLGTDFNMIWRNKLFFICS